MDELHELYQEVILDHNKRPRNFRKLDGVHLSADGFNPLCGDRVTVYVAIESEQIADVSFEGQGCAICTAAASMMTEALKGLAVDEAEESFQRFHAMLTEDDPNSGEGLGKLAAFAGVREFPIRVKCATLPWHTFHSALARSEGTVTTE
jgi:nitrogen fixation NifU-like protein